MKHTQGKHGWQLHSDNSTVYVTSNDKYNRTSTLCSLNYVHQRPDEQEANGKLIAAAPDLLIAADIAFDVFFVTSTGYTPCQKEALERLRNAIQKATL